jgi:hypothetical protein
VGGVLLFGVTVGQAAEPAQAGAAPQPRKTLRLLAIGNSFSQNATEYLPEIVKSQGHTLVLGHASIGGCSLAKHWGLAQVYEANPADPQGRPYYLPQPTGLSLRLSLKEYLRTQAWDVVTMHQYSWDSWNLPTYRPYAARLAAYVRKHAPQAQLWVNETWAYRPDNPLLKKHGMTQAQMYERLHDNYAIVAGEIHAAGIIPTGTAFQNARQDPRWPIELAKGVDVKALKYPEVPPEIHSLCAGWAWDKKVQPPRLKFDGKHGTTAGKYLAAMVWYENFFGAARTTGYLPKHLPPADDTVLRDIAHKAVLAGCPMRPATNAQVEANAEMDTEARPAGGLTAAEAQVRIDLTAGDGLATLGKVEGTDGVTLTFWACSAMPVAGEQDANDADE